MEPQELRDRAQAAAQSILEADRRRLFVVVADNDTDGIASAAQLAVALQRAGRKSRIGFTSEKSTRPLEAALEDPEAVLVTADLGSAHLDWLTRTGRPAIVLDHHVPPGDTQGDRIHHLNAHNVGLPGRGEACAATITYGLVVALDEANQDLAGLALAGAWGDRHYGEDWTGYHAHIARQGQDAGVARRLPGPRLRDEPIARTLAEGNDPLIPGVRNQEQAQHFLAEVQIPDDATGNDLDEAARERLGTALALRLLGIGATAPSVEWLLGDRWELVVPDGRRFDAATLSSLLNGTAKEADPALALAFVLGDESAAPQVDHARAAYRVKLRQGLVALETAHLPTETGTPLVRIAHAEYAGSVASLGLRWLLPRAAGVTLWAPHGPEEAKLSFRLGTWKHSAASLAPVVSEIAAEVGGRGGGHTVAAGAEIPAEAVQRVHEEVWRRIRHELGTPQGDLEREVPS